MPLSDGQGGVDTNFHGIVRIGAARGTCRSRARQGGDMSLPRSRKGRRRVLHEASCLANTSYTTVRKNTTIFVFCEHFKPLPQASTGRGKLGKGDRRVLTHRLRRNSGFSASDLHAKFMQAEKPRQHRVRIHLSETRKPHYLVRLGGGCSP